MNGSGSADGSETKRSRKREQELELIQRAQAGDKQAISELYRLHVDLIYRYVWTRVKDDSLSEDLTAQVFLKALEGLPSYRPGDRPFVAWLYRIAYARIVDHWRKLKRREEVPLEETLPSRAPRPEELLEYEADWCTAMDLLAQLTDDQQDVLILRFIGEMSLADIADTIGKTVGATKALQYRALATLARLLEERKGQGLA